MIALTSMQEFAIWETCIILVFLFGCWAAKIAIKKWFEDPEDIRNKIKETKTMPSRLNQNKDLNKLLKKAKKQNHFLIRILKKKVFNNTVLAWLNVLFVQWFFTRIYRNENWSKFGLLRPVLPLTGWWNDYIYIFPKKAKTNN